MKKGQGEKKIGGKEIAIIAIISIAIVALVIIFAVKRNAGKQISETNKVDEYVQTLDDGTRLNKSDELKKDKTINGLSITNIQLANQNGATVLLADVKNTTSEATKTTAVNIKLLDKQGNVLATVPGLIAPLQEGGTTQLNIGISADFANAYNFEVEAK